MQKQTTMAKTEELTRKWYVVDAKDIPLGRLASKVGQILQGKNKPIYTPHVDCGDYVIIVNAKQDEAMCVLVETKKKVKAKVWKLKGLNPKYQYQVMMREQYNLNKKQIFNKVISGEQLMKKGLNLGSLYSTSDKESYNGIYSRMLYLKRIK